MRCDNCKKEQNWLESVGPEFICSRCIQKHRLMGLIFRTHSDLFKKIMKSLKVKSYKDYMAITQDQIESSVNLEKYDIRLE